MTSFRDLVWKTSEPVRRLQPLTGAQEEGYGKKDSNIEGGTRRRGRQPGGQKLPPRSDGLPRWSEFQRFSKNAKGVELLLFNDAEDDRPERVIPLDPATNLMYHYWNMFLPRVQEGQIYGCRLDGPRDFARGMRFDSSKVLLDPYGRAVIVPRHYSREAASGEGDNASTAMKNVVADHYRVEARSVAVLFADLV